MKQLLGTLCIVLSFVASQSQAEIPFNQALGVYEGTKDEFKHISPLWGMVAINGMLEQIRFFGNYEKVIKQKPRNPNQAQAIEQVIESEAVDKGRDPIAQLIQKLFPSPDGVQFVTNTRNNDPVGDLSRDLGKINGLISILLNNGSQKQKIEQIKTLLKGTENADVKKEEDSRDSFAHLLVSAYQRQAHIANPAKPNQQLYPENIVIISLLGFFAKVADSKQDFTKLPLLMKEGFDQTSVFTKEDYKNNLNDLDTTMGSAQHSPELLFLMAKGFDVYDNPFMKPIQYRGDTCFRTSQGFPDCGETSLRNIFMMLLGKNGVISQEALAQLQSKIDPLDGVNLNDPGIPFQKLITFFKKHPLLSDAATRDSHDAWAKVVSNLNRQEEIGTLEAVQYGRGGKDQTPIYEIKANFSNIGVRGMINMLNVIAKIIPDKQLNEPWSENEDDRLKQVSQKFTRFCELLSRQDHEVSWRNNETQDQTLLSPFGTLTIQINYKTAYDWRFASGHFQIDSYASDVTDWRMAYDAIPFPNEWLAFFYRSLNEIKAIKDDTYASTYPLTFIYNSKLRSLDGTIKTMSFVLYKAIMENTLKQFVPLIARWIDTSVPIDDEYAIYKLSLILYGPMIQGDKTISKILENPKFINIKDRLARLNEENYNAVIYQITQPGSPIFSLVLMAYLLGPEKELSLVLPRDFPITDSILKKINKLTKITSLNLKMNETITDAELQNLTNLTSLNLGWNSNITDEGIQNLTNLTSLDLQENNNITNAGLRKLNKLTSLNLTTVRNITYAGLQHLTDLTSLDLSDNSEITDADLQNFTNLTSLDLVRNKIITDTGLQNLTNLTSLNLSHNKMITDARLQKLTNLTSLDLSTNKVITNTGLQNLTNLTSLDLQNNYRITDEGLQNLVNLTSLNLKKNYTVTDRGLQNLVKLRHLDLTSNREITDAGLQNLINLTFLDLTDNETITDAGLQNLKNLISLYLANSEAITDEGLENLPNLTYLGLEDNNTITDEFIQNHPRINIEGR